ncbi:histidine kinase [Bogoriella caseilytica]|uniref:HicB-like protein involved in pilus formation n=1 Tax=Bogoriella caseilytica TaxID=56055 RepID=A0A3N2BBX0_9MICO|nr:histidine kinase [Bogoriella caseilytica]ROR72767.1 hypothetical protein EDD31_1126 [Bogoriella caseilytica]
MDLSRYLSSLQQALAGSADSAGPEVQEAANRLAITLEPALRLTLMELAADVAAEVTLKLDGDCVELRLRGGNPEIVVERASAAETEIPAPPTPPPAPTPAEDGSTARISLRLPEGLKNQVDEAAGREGVSVNNWLVRAVHTAVNRPEATSSGPVTDPCRRGPRRLDGWVH